MHIHFIVGKARVERIKQKVLNFLNTIQLKNKGFSNVVKYIGNKFCMHGPGGGNKKANTYISLLTRLELKAMIRRSGKSFRRLEIGSEFSEHNLN